MSIYINHHLLTLLGRCRERLADCREKGMTPGPLETEVECFLANNNPTDRIAHAMDLCAKRTEATKAAISAEHVFRDCLWTLRRGRDQSDAALAVAAHRVVEAADDWATKEYDAGIAYEKWAAALRCLSAGEMDVYMAAAGQVP